MEAALKETLIPTKKKKKKKVKFYQFLAVLENHILLKSVSSPMSNSSVPSLFTHLSMLEIHKQGENEVLVLLLILIGIYLAFLLSPPPHQSARLLIVCMNIIFNWAQSHKSSR